LPCHVWEFVFLSLAQCWIKSYYYCQKCHSSESQDASSIAKCTKNKTGITWKGPKNPYHFVQIHILLWVRESDALICTLCLSDQMIFFPFFISIYYSYNGVSFLYFHTCIQYTSVKFTPSILSLHPTYPLLKTISTGLIVLFFYPYI
jgi:hypothetical protein